MNRGLVQPYEKTKPFEKGGWGRERKEAERIERSPETERIKPSGMSTLRNGRRFMEVDRELLGNLFKVFAFFSSFSALTG